MIRRNSFLLKYMFVMLIVFAIGKIGFMYYNIDGNPFGLVDVLSVLLFGLPQDVVTVACMAVVPALVSLIGIRWKSMPLRWILSPYYVLVGLATCIVIVVDACMYEFWQFKLHAIVLSYASSPEGATNSVSLSFIAFRVAAMVVLSLLAIVPAIRFTPRNFEHRKPSLFFIEKHAADVIIAASLVLGALFMNAGRAYYSSTLFLNHAATNSVYNLCASFEMMRQPSRQYPLASEASATETFAPLYAPMSDQGTERLLKTDRPNVLVVLVESFGSKFVTELGGIADVSPNLSRLIPQGIFWNQFYANSFRTDRGTTSVFNGCISYPTLSLMTLPELHDTLPCLAKTLAREGYTTSYLLGGPMTNMGKERYLNNVGFQTLYNNKNGFTAEELATGSWGANDSISAMRTVDIIRKKPLDEHWMMGYQTLSSHEPFDVPYHRLEDKVLNSFAYTDECLGMLIDKLRETPQWDNLLVILVADHGFMYELNYQNPDFFRIPMLWLGGAIKEPRTISTLTNQSDICATLLAQMNICHDDYIWSRNVLSPDYKAPFVYCNYPAGLLFKDASGISEYDLMAGKVVLDAFNDGEIAESEDASNSRVKRAKAILQKSQEMFPFAAK